MDLNDPRVAFVRDRRLWALVASCVAAVVLAFVAVPDARALWFVSYGGFWVVLLTFALWLASLWQTFGAELRALRPREVDWASVAVVGLGGVVLISHEGFGFKILMDELMLLGTSMSMHLDKTAVTPLRGNDIQGTFVILDAIVDKRPLFFPFLVSLLHDLTGYRPENPFLLNGILTFIFLGLVHLAGRLLAGRLAGWIGVALFAGLPLLSHNATGGGFELLNLVMMLAALLLGARFLARRDGASLTAFCFAAMLLAQVRYESVIFVLPTALLVLWVWLRERRPLLSWPVVLAPLLMVHYPMQHRIFDIRASAWEMASKAGSTQPFALSYVPDNLAHAVNFFFARASEQPNSLVLSALGWIAVLFFGLWLVRNIRTLDTQPPVIAATVVFGLGFAMHFALMMGYFFGQFDNIIIRRLSLPTHLGLVLALLAVLPQFGRPVVARVVFALAVLGLVARSVPAMAAHAYSHEYLPGRETAWRREFMASRPKRDYLMIDNDSTLWVTHLVSATPTGNAMARRDSIAFHLRNRTFSDVFVFQRFNIDAETGKLTVREGDDPGPAFVLEPVVEQRLQVLTLSRISRVKEVRSGDVNIAELDRAEHPVPKSRAEIDRLRNKYLENYLKQLP